MTQLKFSENAILHSDEKKRQFINKSIEITEQYINTNKNWSENDEIIGIFNH